MEPFMPPPRAVGRPRTTDLREVMNAILYMASAGCQSGMLPRDFPPPSTVQRYFYAWRATGLLHTIHLHLVAAMGAWTIEIIKRSDTATGFEVLPRRWVVERTFAWLGRCRRLAKDWKTRISSAETWLVVAHIRLITRRLARHCYSS